ncbi:Coy1p [Sugiyamaella lignohabitans]|uniref:Protein CASP n=1 Tax=Sugiyamaella lignohabitans TaxID=796027 RepID=A0A161HLS8_9ASCO|nr:Coy1p [Sugiyamaella lignohabitans]ANB14407.1 Coy1p [Sugiyamaella lignohabitans]
MSSANNSPKIPEDDVNANSTAPTSTGGPSAPEGQSTTTTTSKEALNPFEQAIKVWSDIDLSSLQKSLDDEGDQILVNQTTSVKGRKELASRTKSFRKLSDEEKLVEIKSLLKLYQTEIDNLTNRGKFAETSFMNVYKLLAEAPDPRPLLEASVDSVISASEVNRLMTENARLNDLVSRHADYDSVKAKLLKVEQSSIETARAKVNAKEAEMNALFDEKERNWKLREEELQRQIEDLSANKDVAEARLSAHNSSIDPSEGAKSRLLELELVAGDLERANRKVAQVEKRNLELRTELEGLKSETKANEEKAVLESKISDLEGENAIVLAKIQSLDSKLATQTAASQQKIEVLERDVSRKSEEITTLKNRLHKQQDYEEIKRELDVLKSIEFDVGEDDGERSARSISTQNENAQETKLEKMLLTRNKKLTSDLTNLRVTNHELNEANQAANRQISSLTSELEEARNLNNKLEEDLLTLKNSGTSPAMSTVSGWNNSSWGGKNSVNGRVSPTSSIIGGRDGRDLRGGPTPTTSSSDSSILPIITQQRDRFRQRNAELESELRKNWALISSLQKEVETVKKDNVELYERTRYASSYKAQSKRGGSSAEDRYRSVYEEGLTPFQQFRGRETERALSKMGPLERIVYSFFRGVLSNRLSRNFFFLYCLGLHLLVMVILMYGATSSPVLEVPSTVPGTGAEESLVSEAAVQLAEHP